jgi:hypothetical protein
MNLEQILAAVNDLPSDDLERLKAYLKAREQSDEHQTVDEWMNEFRAIAEAFRGNSSDEEMRDIVAAMNLKTPPSDKGT